MYKGHAAMLCIHEVNYNTKNRNAVQPDSQGAQE